MLVSKEIPHSHTFLLPSLSGGEGAGTPTTAWGDGSAWSRSTSPGKQLQSPIPPFKHQRDNSVLALGLRSSTQSEKTRMEPEAVTDGQSTQRPSRGSTGKQTLHLLLPGTKALGDEEDKEKDEDEGSRCQHSPSSPQQRVKKGWRASSSPPASSVRAEAQRASSPQSLEGWSSCTGTQS